MRRDADSVTELHQTPFQNEELGIDGETVSSLSAHTPAILLGFGFYYSIVYVCIMGELVQVPVEARRRIQMPWKWSFRLL